MVVTAEEAGTAHVWDATQGTQLAEFSGDSGPVNWATFSEAGTLVLTTSDDGTASIFSCGTCRRLPELLDLAAQRVTRTLTPAERAKFL
jgi:WD40 repeat protein